MMPPAFIPCVYHEEERADIAGLAWYLWGVMVTIYPTSEGYALTRESHGPYKEIWEDEVSTHVTNAPSHEDRRRWLREELTRLLYNQEP